MSRIDKLIEEMCPDGVANKKLIDIATVIYGFPFQSNLFTEDESYIPLIRIRDIKPGIASIYYKGDFSPEFIIKKGDILVGTDGEFNLNKWNDRKSILNQRVCKIVTKDENITNNSYLFHLLIPLLKKIENQTSSSTVKHLSAKAINSISIPIPPLPIQQEIVNILDKFTALDAELQAELEARKKQFEYYRNQLLNFEGKEVEWKILGEIGEFYGGLTGKNKNDFHGGNARFVTYMNVFSNITIKTDMDSFVKIGENENQNRIDYGDVLFTGSSETPDECGMSSVLTIKVDEPLYLNSFCFGFRLNDKDLFLPDFMKYLFRAEEVRKQIGQTASGVTRFNISKKRFAKVVVPTPSTQAQLKIVTILDNFTLLVSEIEAEIEARRKQYEYYREKLLTFKKAEQIA